MLNKVKVVVASNREMHVDKAVAVHYTCQYEINGKVRMIDSFGNYRELSGSQVGRKDADGNPTGHIPIILQFSKTVMYKEYVFDDEATDEHNKNIQNIVQLFYGQCPLFLVNGKPHTPGQSGDQFDIIDSNIKTLTAVHSFKDKLRASNKLADMTHSERSDVAFFYGKHPIGKSEEELLVELADAETGFCLQDENLSDFLKVWVDGKSDERDLLVTFKKAIGQGVINNKQEDGRNAYFLGETFLGSDDVGLIDWSRKNPRDFSEHIVRKTATEEKKEEKVVKSIVTSAITKIDPVHLEELRKQAKQLVDEGFFPKEKWSANLSYEKLKMLLAEVLKKKDEIDA